MGKQAVNKYKVTIAKNTKLSIDEQVKKAFDFLSAKLGIDFDISIQDTTVTPTLREMYKLPNGQMRYTANQIDSDIFIYEQEASYKNGFVTGYTFPTGKITLPVSQLDIASDWLWKVISHEMIHRFEKQLAEKGKPVVDEMDNTFVAGKLVPYYKNDTPEAKDGNYSVMFKKLLPLVPYLVETEQTSDVVITRNKSTKYETTGELVAKINGTTFTCKTLELPWLDNASNISCIPKGLYTVKWTFSPKFLRYTYQVMNVPNRSGIRIHAGNYYKDYKGCIGLGRTFADLNKDGEIDITSTQATVKAFEALMNKRTFTLEIK